MQNYNKFIISLLAAAGVIASSNLLTGSAELWVNTCVAAVSAALVVWFPNIRKPEPADLSLEPAQAPVQYIQSATPQLPAAEDTRPSLADDQPGPPDGGDDNNAI